MHLKHPEKRTRHFNILLVLVAVGAAAAIAWNAFDVSAHTRAAGHWMSGRSDHPPGHGIDRFCAGDRAAAVEGVLAYGASALDIGDEQAAAWDRFAASVRAADTTFDGVCAEIAATGETSTAPAALALVENAMALGLEAVREVRPAFDELYATMTDEQRETLDRAIADHRRH